MGDADGGGGEAALLGDGARLHSREPTNFAPFAVNSRLNLPSVRVNVKRRTVFASSEADASEEAGAERVVEPAPSDYCRAALSVPREPTPG